jgi:hypothetical protein
MVVRNEPRHYLFSDRVPLVQLQDSNGDVIAFFRPIKRTRYEIGDVYGELHFLRNGAGTVVGHRSHSSSDHILTLTATDACKNDGYGHGYCHVVSVL